MNKKTDYKNEILELLNKRSVGKSICPSEVLDLELKKDKECMDLVRRSAVELVKENKIVITQKGIEVDPDNFKGPIRLRKK